MKMGFKRLEFNKTQKVKEEGSVISGKKDAIFLRNKYQTEIDNSWIALVNMIHYCEEESKKVRNAYNEAQEKKQNIEAENEERIKLYESLQNLLTKETDFETKLWETTNKNKKADNITIKQKFSDSDVDEMKFDGMRDYLKQYPEYASKSSFRKILTNIEDKEKEIKKSKKDYNKAVSQYNYYLSFMPKHLLKAEDKVNAYEEILQEGQDKLANSRFKKGVFYKMASEETKAKVCIDTIKHRIEQQKNTLKLLQEDYGNIEKKQLTELSF